MVATLCVPDVQETFLKFFFADNFTGAKDTKPYKTDVSFLCQYIFQISMASHVTPFWVNHPYTKFLYTHSIYTRQKKKRIQ